MKKNKLATLCIALLAILLWFALGLQFYISTVKYIQQGRTFAGAIVQILSYFTIQTNILLAVALTAILVWPSSAWGRFFSRPTVLTTLAVYIAIVGLVYQIILSKQFHLQGLFILTDNILHGISPLLYVLFWFLFMQKQLIKWGEGLKWLIYPFCYFIYAIARGTITGYYPYSFIDANLISYPQIFINFIFLLITFFGICMIFIALSRSLSKLPAQAT